MEREIVRGVAEALRERCGIPATVKGEAQSPAPPCFTVSWESREENPAEGRQKRRVSFDIRYTAEQGEAAGALYQLAVRGLAALRMVALPDGHTVRGNSLHFELVRGALHLFSSYQFFL